MAYTSIDNPELYFQTKLYTGDGSSTQAITLDGDENMQPDWIWIKNRTDGHYHNLNDSVRGVGAAAVLRSNTNGVEGGTSGHVSVIGSNGFTVAAGTSDSEEVNTSSDNYVAWNWKAGTSFSNSAGANGADLASDGSYNRTAGFSIVKFTGNATANQQIYHGLNSIPKVMILKNRTNGNNESWSVYHQSVGNTKKITLDTTAAPATSNEFWEDTTPTSTVFTVGRQDATNGSGNTHSVYCFSEVKGYSKFGSYTGNGNADGTFVYTGFRPAWVMVKRTDTTNNWLIWDTKREGYNVDNDALLANTSDAEETDDRVDILSNGFKMRGSQVANNASGGTYIYMAFAEAPFVTSSGVPACAR